LRIELRHQRRQQQAFAACAGNEHAQRVGCMRDVGVGQQQVVGRRRPRFGMADAVIECRKLSRPAGLERRRAQDRHA